MKNQKFHIGDIVRIKKNCGWPNLVGKLAIVMGSYEDLYGSTLAGEDYSLLVEKEGGCSWFTKHELERISHDRDEIIRIRKTIK